MGICIGGLTVGNTQVGVLHGLQVYVGGSRGELVVFRSRGVRVVFGSSGAVVVVVFSDVVVVFCSPGAVVVVVFSDVVVVFGSSGAVVVVAFCDPGSPGKGGLYGPVLFADGTQISPPCAGGRIPV